ncbi:hypothetical protein Tco_0312270, partial [Tanacetum coccineum]
MLSCYSFSPIHSLEPLKDGWTVFLQEPSIPRISLKSLLSKGTARHQKPLSSLKKSETSSRKATKHYTKLENDIMTCFINAQLETDIKQKESQKHQSQAQNGKDKFKSRP